MASLPRSICWPHCLQCVLWLRAISFASGSRGLFALVRTVGCGGGSAGGGVDGGGGGGRARVRWGRVVPNRISWRSRPAKLGGASSSLYCSMSKQALSAAFRRSSMLDSSPVTARAMSRFTVPSGSCFTAAASALRGAEPRRAYAANGCGRSSGCCGPSRAQSAERQAHRRL